MPAKAPTGALRTRNNGSDSPERRQSRTDKVIEDTMLDPAQTMLSRFAPPL
jgi:hypothetical protein